jgi:hypothetical protein
MRQIYSDMKQKEAGKIFCHYSVRSNIFYAQMQTLVSPESHSNHVSTGKPNLTWGIQLMRWQDVKYEHFLTICTLQCYISLDHKLVDLPVYYFWQHEVYSSRIMIYVVYSDNLKQIATQTKVIKLYLEKWKKGMQNLTGKGKMRVIIYKQQIRLHCQ